MAYSGFANKPLKGENIKIVNYGNSKRNFTYIDIRIMAKVLFTSNC